ncbi:MAG: hypothetical protein ACLTER_11805 [Ruminococcus sp.]
MYDKDLDVVAIHAGLECGIFYERMENLDCTSLGPDILDIHTSKERLDMASVKAGLGISDRSIEKFERLIITCIFKSLFFIKLLAYPH